MVIFNKHIAVSCCGSHCLFREKGPSGNKTGWQSDIPAIFDKFNAGAGGITVSTNRDGHLSYARSSGLNTSNSTLLPFTRKSQNQRFLLFPRHIPGRMPPGSLQDGIFINSGRLFRGKTASDVTNFGQTFSISPRVNSFVHQMPVKRTHHALLWSERLFDHFRRLSDFHLNSPESRLRLHICDVGIRLPLILIRLPRASVRHSGIPASGR